MPLDLLPPDRSRLERSPLELVVFQVRYENRLVVSDPAVALAVHEVLGGPSGPYGRIDPAEGTSLSVAVGTGPTAVSESKLSGWRLVGDDGWVVSLMPDHVGLETTAYTTWDEFEPRLHGLLDAVQEHVEPAIEQRIGLRYVDQIRELQIADAAGWEPYIRPELLGPILHPQFGPAVRATFQQVLVELERGVTCGLRHGTAQNETGTMDYVLDYDVFREGGRGFDPAAIKAAASAFNTYALQLFQASITETLFDLLGRE